MRDLVQQRIDALRQQVSKLDAELARVNRIRSQLRDQLAAAAGALTALNDVVEKAPKAEAELEPKSVPTKKAKKPA